MVRRMKMEQISVNDFRQKVMENDLPVVLEFHGSFCSGCAAMEPLLEEEESRYYGRIFFGVIDADHEPLLNTALKVYHLPSLFFFHDGHLLARHDGVMSAEKLENQLKKMAA